LPVGTGVATLNTLPDVPYEIDPALFSQLTEGNVQPLDTFAAPGPGNSTTFYLPKSGVVSQLSLTFVGTLTVTAAGSGDTQPVPSSRWPYGLLSGLNFSAGLGSDLWDANGLDLAALWHTDHPHSHQSSSDEYPGDVGGGGEALAAGTYPIELRWEVPIAVDQTTLIASLYAQSSSSNISIKISQEQISNLIETGGTASLWSITGNFIPREKLWEIPVQKGKLILPDITHVHIGAGIDQALTGTGRQPAQVQRTSGVLQRLFLRAELAPTGFLSALASTPVDALIDQIQINYGLTQTPMIFNPGSELAAINAKHYGVPLPYDTYVLDTLVENPQRDAILLAGVTELQALVYPNPAVTIPAGAHTRVFEEILA